MYQLTTDPDRDLGHLDVFCSSQANHSGYCYRVKWCVWYDICTTEYNPYWTQSRAVKHEYEYLPDVCLKTGPTRKSATHSGSAYFYDYLTREFDQGAPSESATLTRASRSQWVLAEICSGGKGWAMGNPRLLNELMAESAEFELSYSIE